MAKSTETHLITQTPLNDNTVHVHATVYISPGQNSAALESVYNCMSADIKQVHAHHSNRNVVLTVAGDFNVDVGNEQLQVNGAPPRMRAAAPTQCPHLRHFCRFLDKWQLWIASGTNPDESPHTHAAPEGQTDRELDYILASTNLLPYFQGASTENLTGGLAHTNLCSTLFEFSDHYLVRASFAIPDMTPLLNQKTQRKRALNYGALASDADVRAAFQASAAHSLAAPAPDGPCSPTLKQARLQASITAAALAAEIPSKRSRALVLPKNVTNKLSKLYHQQQHTEEKLLQAIRNGATTAKKTKLREVLQDLEVRRRTLHDAAVLARISREPNNARAYRALRDIIFFDSEENQKDPNLQALAASFTNNGNITFDVTDMAAEIQAHFANAQTVNANDPNFDAQFYQEACAKVTAALSSVTTGTPAAAHNIILRKPVNRAEVQHVLQRLPKNKQPGADGLPYGVLMYGGDAIADAIAELATMVQDTLSMPHQWQEGLMILLHKKGSLLDLGNYRPITLLNTVMKIYEKILLRRLTEWLQAENKINQFQTGFQPGLSTVDQAALLHAVLKHRRKRRKATYVAFLDITKAFPSSDHTLLWLRMMEEGLSPDDTALLKLLCTDCFSRVRFQYDQTTDKIHIHMGVKEGACLSPLEFLLFLNNLPGYLRDEKKLGVKVGDTWVGILMHADDICLLADNEAELQAMLAAVVEYLQRYRLRLSTDKCVVLVVETAAQRAKRAPISIMLATYDIPITEKPSRTYLGFIFTHDLSWSEMCAYRLARCQTFVNRLKLHKQQFHNIDATAAVRIWTTYGRPLLEYGMALWAETQSLVAKLESMQLRALKAMAPLPTSTSTPLLLAAFNLPTMALRVKAARFAFLTRSDKQALTRPHRTIPAFILTQFPNSQSALFASIHSDFADVKGKISKWICLPPQLEDLTDPTREFLMLVGALRVPSPDKRTPLLHPNVAFQLPLRTLCTIISAFSSYTFASRLRKGTYKQALPPCAFCHNPAPFRWHTHCLLHCTAINGFTKSVQNCLTADPQAVAFWTTQPAHEQRRLLCCSALQVDLGAVLEPHRIALAQQLANFINTLYDAAPQHGEAG